MITVILPILAGVLLGVLITPHVRGFFSGLRLAKFAAQQAPIAPYANELLELLQGEQLIPEDWSALLIISDGDRCGLASNTDPGPHTAAALRKMADDIDSVTALRARLPE